MFGAQRGWFGGRGMAVPDAWAPLVLVLVAGALSAGCALWRPTVTPLRQQTLLTAAASASELPAKRCLAVLLPGRFDSAESFAQAGFADAVRERGLALDVVAVDAHFGYYRKRTVLERLRADVVAPARAAGYEQIWIGGVSLGGLGSLLYLRDHPEDLAGVVALAPFLGADPLIAEIAAAGGPARWQPGEPGDRADDVGRELWRWFAPWLAGPQPLPLYLGWGESDALAPSNRLAASLLPPERVFPLPGGHDWRTWRALWDQFLDRAAPCESG